MLLTIEGERATLSKYDKRILQFAPAIEGRKNYLKSGGFAFEATPFNLEKFAEVYSDVPIEDKRVDAPQAVASSQVFDSGLGSILYEPKTQPYAHQRRAIIKLGPLPYFALLMEQGTGKTKVLIDIVGAHFLAGRISALLIITKKGVHNQWIDEQLPKHMGPSVQWAGWAWTGSAKKVPEWLFTPDPTKLKVLTINVDAPNRSKAAYDLVLRFILAHGGNVIRDKKGEISGQWNHAKVFAAVDESQDIKDLRSGRTKTAIELGWLCAFRAILTGTPIAKDLTDEFAQFRFLSENIIGHRYISTFRAQYCIMGGFEGRAVVGSKNVETLFARTDPVSFRVTKEEELDLPPKVYDKVVFELTDEQKKLYKELKENFLIELEQGTATVANAAVAVMRLQQIASGYLVLEDGTIVDLPNPRLDRMRDVLEQRQGKAVIWARFNRDIENIMAALGSEAVDYYGATSPSARKINKERFLEDDTIRYFVSNPAAGGTGIDGLQTVGRTALYYTNSFDALHRWQSEDRTHRIGMGGTCTYIDLVARGTVDVKILSNLRAKKSLSDLVLDDIRKVFEDDLS